MNLRERDAGPSKEPNPARTSPSSAVTAIGGGLHRVKRRLFKTLARIRAHRAKEAERRRKFQKQKDRLRANSQRKAQIQFLGHFRDLCGLQPHESVLDVGCGLGILTLPLTQYLDATGRYEGFDVAVGRVRKCREKVSRFYPNFRFQVADIYNKSYNPEGRYKASEYRFPYEDESFDFVFARSVFTHMLPEDVDNYVAQIARVLKPNGRSLVTFFLFNDRTPRQQLRKFPHDFGVYRTRRRDVPEVAVAYPEAHVRALYAKHGLRIAEPIRFGTASGSEDAVSRQDMVIATKA